MPLLGVILMFKYHGYYSIVYRSEFANALILLALILTLLFPFISIFVLYKSGLISDLNLTKRKERVVPALITVGYYFGFYYFLRQYSEIDEAILSGFLGGCIALLISIYITKYWKISLHVQGVASLAGFFIGVTEVTYISHTSMSLYLILAIGLVSSSRLFLHKHTAQQVAAGAVLGFIVPYVFVVLGWYI